MIKYLNPFHPLQIRIIITFACFMMGNNKIIEFNYYPNNIANMCSYSDKHNFTLFKFVHRLGFVPC